MLTVCGLNAAAVCDEGSICGDETQFRIVFSSLACLEPMA